MRGFEFTTLFLVISQPIYDDFWYADSIYIGTVLLE